MPAKMESYVHWSDDQLMEAGINRARLERALLKVETGLNELDKLGLNLYVGDSIGIMKGCHHEGLGEARRDRQVATVMSHIGYDGGAW